MSKWTPRVMFCAPESYRDLPLCRNAGIAIFLSGDDEEGYCIACRKMMSCNMAYNPETENEDELRAWIKERVNSEAMDLHG